MLRILTLLLVALLSSDLGAQNAKNYLLDISVQTQGMPQDFSYNTNLAIPVDEIFRIPMPSTNSDGLVHELQVLARLPKGSATQDLLELQIEMYSKNASGEKKTLGQAKFLTRPNESAAVSDKSKGQHTILFTVTTLKAQKP